MEYRDYRAEVDATAARINERWATDDWEPIILDGSGCEARSRKRSGVESRAIVPIARKLVWPSHCFSAFIDLRIRNESSSYALGQFKQSNGHKWRSHTIWSKSC